MMRNVILWMVIAGVLYVVAQSITPQAQTREVNYSEFIQMVKSGQVEEVQIGTNRISGTLSGTSIGGADQFETVKPPILDLDLLATLDENGVTIVGKEPERESFLTQLFLSILPILLVLGIFMFFMRQMQGGGRGGAGPMTFGKSRARLLGEDQIKTTFADVAGVEEAKEEVQELVEFLRDPGKFQRLGGKIPKGVLMVGSPGTGKTLLAKAIAGEARVPFFSISGSDFVEMFVGVGASRVRDMFEQAKKHAPCIIFIDEIDAVGRSRGAGMGGGHDEREQTLNQLLVEMDGFEGHEGIIVIAATNRPDVLDAALLRPGRFDRQVVVPLPDIRGREQIIKVHMRSVPVGNDVEPDLIARGTPGFSGADLANLVNEAALFAARANKRLVGMEEFEKAKDKILMGAERRSMVMSEKEKLNTAYHEAGHAIVGRLVPEHDPVYKVSIIPRGRALGVTMYLPEEDKYSQTKQAIESSISSLFGGRIAEEMINGFDGVTTGASNDIERATKMARAMVTKWGLSEKLGPLAYEEDEGEVFLGKSVTQHKHVSAQTAEEIDREVRAIIDKCYARARGLLEENSDKLELMAQALMQYETIDARQIDDIMEGREPRPPKDWNDPGAGTGGAVSDDEQGDAGTDPIGGPANTH
ncbi:MAG: ATP-dependent zinc metalloprotease FtsH [Alcanivoracaceae bacterium]|nr:ATP-dependent zinc metalloprotease FtsH [Alcanivoracaceae bacterium]